MCDREKGIVDTFVEKALTWPAFWLDAIGFKLDCVALQTYALYEPKPLENE